jgi:coiled-coil domain-containing protein 40
MQKIEVTKKQQDYLVDHLQNRIRSAQNMTELHDAQLMAQARETRAAQETLAQAAMEMDEVQFAQKQLLTQWQSSLLAIQRRDEAVKVRLTIAMTAARPLGGSYTEL